MKIKISKRDTIAPKNVPIIVAEISGNHNGNKTSFLKHIKTAAKNGANMIKIQTYEPHDITLKNFNKKFIVNAGIWKNNSLWNLYKKAHTPFSWHADAFKLCKKLNITLFSSPFSKRAVDFLEKFNVPLYKIASFEITDYDLIDYVAQKRKPIILSTGMDSILEIKLAIKIIKRYHNKIIILYCVSGYPTKEADSNLNNIKKFKEIFKGFNIGLSDHTDNIFTSLASTTFGVSLIEKHFIISKKMHSLDKKFSIDKDQLKLLSEGVKKTFWSLGDSKKKLNKIEKNNLKYRRSIFSIKDIEKNQKISRKNIGNFRPVIGLESNNYFKILGLKAKKKIKKHTPIFIKDLKK